LRLVYLALLSAPEVGRTAGEALVVGVGGECAGDVGLWGGRERKG
jgi:hypothetical protein